MIYTCSTVFIRLRFFKADDGPRDSRRVRYRTSSSCPIKDSRVMITLTLRSHSLLQFPLLVYCPLINEGATIRRARGKMSGWVCSARFSGNKTWVFWAAWQSHKVVCCTHGLLTTAWLLHISPTTIAIFCLHSGLPKFCARPRPNPWPARNPAG